MPTDSIRDAAFCDVLNRELVCALGCTEPIAVAYAAALASQTLGCEPDHMDVACSLMPLSAIPLAVSITCSSVSALHGPAITIGRCGSIPGNMIDSNSISMTV